MKEPLLAVDLEQKALKLLEILQRRAFARQDSIGYLAAELLDVYNDGYDACILTRK